MKIFLISFCIFLPPLLSIFCFLLGPYHSVLYCAHFCMKCSLGILIFLKRSIVFPIRFPLFLCIDHWGRLFFFFFFKSLLAILWNSAFKWVYLSFSPLPLASLLFSAICKGSSDNHFAFWHLFFLEVALILDSCTMSQTSVHSSSGTVYQISSLESICHFHYIIIRVLI